MFAIIVDMPKEVLIPLIVLVSLFIIFLIISIITGLIYFNRVFRRRKGNTDEIINVNKTSNEHPDRLWLDSLNKEKVMIKSHDKLNLNGYFVDNNGSLKVALLVHGYHGSHRSMASQARMFYEHGYSLLLIDLRCHGESEGKYFSMGRLETRDLKDWIDYLNSRNDNYRIILFGVSLGAHLVMNSLDKLPFNVMCAIEDSGFTSLSRQMLYTSNLTRAPLFRYSTWACSFVSSLFFRFSIHNDARVSISKSRIPVLFMHGEIDGVVPYINLGRASSYFPKNIYKEVYTFKDCDHLEAVHLKRDLYNDKIISFVDQFVK